MTRASEGEKREASRHCAGIPLEIRVSPESGVCPMVCNTPLFVHHCAENERSVQMRLIPPKKLRRSKVRILTKSRLDPTRCPLCGARNQCGLTAGAKDCWCFAQVVSWQPPPTLPSEILGSACLCRPCLTSQKALDRALEQMALTLTQH
jgi:hypothetical protein